MAGFDPFGDLLRTKMMIDQDKFQRQKYNDLIQRQRQADAMAMQGQQQQADAQNIIRQSLQRQNDVQMNQGPLQPGFQPQVDYRSLVNESVMNGGGNPALMAQLSPYAAMIEQKNGSNGQNIKAFQPQLLEKNINGKKVKYLASPVYNPNTGITELVEYELPAGSAVTEATPLEKVDLALKTEGGKIDLKSEEKRKEMFKKATPQLSSLKRQWDTVGKTIDEAIALVNPFTAGVGAWASSMPATPQRTLKAKLDTIRANVGFDKLQDMRNNSPTGGALGQVSEMENRLLQAVQGAIEQDLSASELTFNLQRIKQNFRELEAQTEQAYLSDYADFIGNQQQKPPTVTTKAQFDALPSGSIFIEDGKQYRKP